MGSLTVNQAAENISGLVRQRFGKLPTGAAVQVRDSSRVGLVSVAWCDSGGYPLFAVNVDLQGIPAARQQLQQALDAAPTSFTWR